jgi:hypothetical protein
VLGALVPGLALRVPRLGHAPVLRRPVVGRIALVQVRRAVLCRHAAVMGHVTGQKIVQAALVIVRAGLEKHVMPECVRVIPIAMIEA